MVGLVLTILSYSFFFSAEYPDISNEQKQALNNCFVDCKVFETSEVISSGFPLKSHVSYENGLTLDYSIKGPVNPVIILAFIGTLQLYLNIIFWVLSLFVAHRIMSKKEPHK